MDQDQYCCHTIIDPLPHLGFTSFMDDAYNQVFRMYISQNFVQAKAFKSATTKRCQNILVLRNFFIFIHETLSFLISNKKQLVFRL